MTEPKVTQTRGAFSLACSVAVNIRARAERIWNLLTDAKNFPRWNSMVAGIEGEIREGEQLRLRVPGTDRTFTPRVSGVVPGERMTWAGGLAPVFKGVRTFELRARSDGSVDFSMEERFSGLMFAAGQGLVSGLGAGVRSLRERPENRGGTSVGHEPG